MADNKSSLDNALGQQVHLLITAPDGGLFTSGILEKAGDCYVVDGQGFLPTAVVSVEPRTDTFDIHVDELGAIHSRLVPVLQITATEQVDPLS